MIDELEAAGRRLAEVPLEPPALRIIVDRRRRMLRVGLCLAVIAAGSASVAYFSWTTPPPVSIAKSSNDTTGSPSTDDAIDLVLAGANLVRTEALVASGSEVLTWTNTARDTFFAVTVRSGLSSKQFEPPESEAMALVSEFPAEQGTSWWRGSATDHSTKVSMWWSRPDGDVWIVNAQWYGPSRPTGEVAGTRAQNWALDLSHSRDIGTPLSDVSLGGELGFVGDDAAGELRSEARVWDYKGHEITLVALQDAAAVGYANVVVIGAPLTVTVAGSQGLLVTDVDGTVTIGWQGLGDVEIWYTLTVPAELRSEKDLIVSAVTSNLEAAPT